MSTARYHRQMLLGQIGLAGQEKLAQSRALLIGCGALGTVLADLLVRAGVGHLTVVDRDIVELTNLQRQTLFDEADARDGIPKAVAAEMRLRAINSGVEIAGVVADVHSGNIEDLIGSRTDLLLDGTDNVQTRYLINDVAVKQNIPWVYGAAVGTEGRVMPIVPGRTPCLRCIFPNPPTSHDLPTCDTAGVLGPAAAMVASCQAAEAIKILSGNSIEPVLLCIELWPWNVRLLKVSDARVQDCSCCGKREFAFLNAPPGDGALSLCGRNAVQIRPMLPITIRLEEVAQRLAPAGKVQRTAHLVRCALGEPSGVVLTVFPDGRALIHGTSDFGRARSVYSRFLGA